MSKRVIYKSAIDGRFVTKAYALAHPKRQSNRFAKSNDDLKLKRGFQISLNPQLRTKRKFGAPYDSQLHVRTCGIDPFLCRYLLRTDCLFLV